MDIPDLSDDTSCLSLLRNAQATLQEANRHKGQKPSVRVPRAKLIQNQLIYQYGPTIANPTTRVQTHYIAHKYPPSIAPLSALKKAYINDLRLQTNHRGSYVLLRTIAPPSKMGAVMNAVEDENGGCDFIELYNMDQNRDPRKILPEGQVLIVKEPFYKASMTGGTSIRVDHVSDVMFLSADNSRVPLKWQPRITSVDKTAADWKEEGNVLFRDGQFTEAIKCYTKGLEAAESIIKTLKLNRAQAFLSAGLHDKALSDSDSILQSDPKNEKALFRGAKALYQARRYKECKSRLTTHIQTYPSNKEAKSILLKVYQRLQEEQTGKYNFKDMRALTSSKQKGPVKLDCADFVGPVELQNTVSSGRGLFATRDIKFGELLLCSKAFCVCHPETDGISLVADLMTGRMQESSGFQLVSEVVQKLYKNPSTSKEFLQLFSGEYKRVQKNEVDGIPIVDTFLAHEIRTLNSFGYPMPSSATKNISKQRAPERSGGVGIWVMPALINHSCQGAGSARRSFIGDMMVVRASRDIKKGEEITHAYFHTSDVSARREALLKSWGFSCDCSLCVVESEETLGVRNDRQRQLAAILSLGSAGQISSVLLQRLSRLIRSLEDTYTKPATEQPRHVLFEALQHLAGFQLGDTDGFLRTLERSLEALGYKIGESEGRVFIAQHGSISNFLIELFHQCSEVCTASGKLLKAKSYYEIAASFWEVIFGERGSFYEKYPNHFVDEKLLL